MEEEQLRRIQHGLDFWTKHGARNPYYAAQTKSSLEEFKAWTKYHIFTQMPPEKVFPSWNWDDVDGVLDVGCGPGFLLHHIPCEVDYCGVDFSSPMLAQLLLDHPNRVGTITLVKENLLELALDREFGLTVCNLVFLHLPHSEQDKIFRHMVDHTKRGGLIWCQWPKETGQLVRDRFTLQECLEPVRGSVTVIAVDTELIEKPGKYYNVVLRVK